MFSSISPPCFFRQILLLNLELTGSARLASALQRSACFCLLDAGITDERSAPQSHRDLLLPMPWTALSLTLPALGVWNDTDCRSR